MARSSRPDADRTTDLTRWLGDAGFADVTISAVNGFAYFAGLKI